MSKFLRQVQHKTNWDPQGEFSSYIPPGQAPADALEDLVTDDNALSIWEVDDLGTNLERILAAMASRRQNLQKMDYLIVNSEHVYALGLAMEQKPGETHDDDANKRWHYDLIHLSASDVSRFANAMFLNGKAERKREPDLISSLRKSIASRFIDEAKLSEGLRERIFKNST
jgi:hypothetical protein